MVKNSNDIIERAGASDFDELIDMMDAVFSERAPHDFRNYLPALYKPDNAHCNCNFIIRRSGKIVASLGVFPIEINVGKNATLRAAGIGGVAVRKEMRGQGLMKKLMNAALENMAQEDFDLCYLGGQRQRYQYFGFERCGAQYNLTITKDNLRHSLDDNLSKNITLKKVENEPDLIEQIQKLHQSQPIWCGRNLSAFGDYLRQWNKSGWVALDAHNQVIAYLCASPDSELIGDFAGKDIDSGLALIKLWIENNGDARLLFPIAPVPLLRKLVSICEKVTVEPSGNWRIFNWEKMVTAFLNLQQNSIALETGEVVIGISDLDIKLSIWLNETGSGCALTNKKPDVSMTSCQTAALLFGPTRPGAIVDISAPLKILESWCPLPLHLPLMDHV